MVGAILVVRVSNSNYCDNSWLKSLFFYLENENRFLKGRKIKFDKLPIPCY